MDFWHSVGVVDGLFWAGCSVKDVLSPTHHMFRNELAGDGGCGSPVSGYLTRLIKPDRSKHHH